MWNGLTHSQTADNQWSVSYLQFCIMIKNTENCDKRTRILWHCPFNSREILENTTRFLLPCGPFLSSSSAHGLEQLQLPGPEDSWPAGGGQLLTTWQGTAARTPSWLGHVREATEAEQSHVAPQLRSAFRLLCNWRFLVRKWENFHLAENPISPL